jgi:5-methylthioadenosine/S-adenosylhomocysteine deaminase
MPTLKIENARFILTLDGERRVIRDGSIVVDGQRISQVGKADELASVGAERVIDATGMVVTPAFVNAHMHLSYAHAVRGVFPDDLVGMDRMIHVFKLQWEMTEEEEYYTSLLAIIELVKSGTVTMVDPGSTKHLDACLQAYEDAGCRVVTGEGLIDVGDARKLPSYPTEEALARTERLIKRYDGRLDGRLRAWAMPFGTESCSPELLAGCKRLADEYGTGMTLHHSTVGRIRQRCLEEYGLTPTAYLEKIDALGPNVLLAHAVGIDDSEVECVARNGASVVICPSNVMKEAKALGERKLPELLERGVSVALGSDSANSSNYLDTIRVMNAAAVGVRDARQQPGLVPAEQALEMATLHGARAVGQADQIGSLEVGKKADLVLFDARRAEWRALFNPVNNLVYNADAGSVHTVVADGRVVVENHQVVFADEFKVSERVQELGEGLLARLGLSYPPGRWPVH